MKKAFLIPIIVVLFSCNTKKNAVEANTTLFTILHSSAYQGRAEASNVVIDNQSDLTALFQSVGSTMNPTVDFAKNQVAAIFIGTKNTGGYSVVIDKVVEEEGTIAIYTKIERPGPGEMVTMAITNPFIIVEIHNKKEIVFK